MSRLQRDAMSARVAKLPYLPTIAPPYDNLEDVEEREEAMSSLGSLPTMLPPSSRYLYPFTYTIKLLIN